MKVFLTIVVLLSLCSSALARFNLDQLLNTLAETLSNFTETLNANNGSIFSKENIPIAKKLPPGMLISRSPRSFLPAMLSVDGQVYANFSEALVAAISAVNASGFSELNPFKKQQLKGRLVGFGIEQDEETSEISFTGSISDKVQNNDISLAAPLAFPEKASFRFAIYRPGGCQ